MRIARWVIGLVVAAVVVVVGGTWIYINVIRDEPPDRLALTETTGTTAVDAATQDEGTAEEPVGIDGTWTTTDGSTVGYRVPEVLFGQETEGVGRTEDVTGSVIVEGSIVTAADFEADLTTVRSDDDRRDNQFRTRLLDTPQFPTATFRLIEPIPLGRAVEAGELVSTTAVGELTMRGTTRPVSIALQARQTGDTFEVAGSLPIVFAEWGIPNPSNVAASVGDEGLLELLLVLTKIG